MTDLRKWGSIFKVLRWYNLRHVPAWSKTKVRDIFLLRYEYPQEPLWRANVPKIDPKKRNILLFFHSGIAVGMAGVVILDLSL